MAEYIHLVGAEEVSRAASTIRSAADDMQSAANTFNETLFQMRNLWQEQEIALDAFVSRLEKMHATDR